MNHINYYDNLIGIHNKFLKSLRTDILYVCESELQNFFISFLMKNGFPIEESVKKCLEISSNRDDLQYKIDYKLDRVIFLNKWIRRYRKRLIKLYETKVLHRFNEQNYTVNNEPIYLRYYHDFVHFTLDNPSSIEFNGKFYNVIGLVQLSNYQTNYFGKGVLIDSLTSEEIKKLIRII